VPPAAKPWPSRSDVRELERRGVVGREERLLRVCEVERWFPLLSMAPVGWKPSGRFEVVDLEYCCICKTNTK